MKYKFIISEHLVDIEVTWFVLVCALGFGFIYDILYIRKLTSSDNSRRTLRVLLVPGA
jgi:hypothetical protein